MNYRSILSFSDGGKSSFSVIMVHGVQMMKERGREKGFHKRPESQCDLRALFLVASPHHYYTIIHYSWKYFALTIHQLGFSFDSEIEGHLACRHCLNKPEKRRRSNLGPAGVECGKWIVLLFFSSFLLSLSLSLSQSLSVTPKLEAWEWGGLD